MEKTIIYNGKVITPDRIIENGYIFIQGNHIKEIGTGQPDLADDIFAIDAEGKYISPGFIDIHVHGGGGFDFMDGTVEAFLGVAETHLKYGTTAMFPTTLTSEVEDLYTTLDSYRQAKAINNKGAQLMGVHLEGPYLDRKSVV